MPLNTVLIVEDEAIVALDLKLQLQELGYDVIGITASGEAAVAAVQARTPDVILMDVRLQGRLDGIEAAQAIRSTHDVPVIFLTSHSDDATVQRAAHTAAYGYLTKPYQIKELRAGIEVALTKSRIRCDVWPTV
jgi:CheY-like chemotaxis protein